MEVYIKCNKIVIITEPKTIRFNLTKKTDNSLKHEIDFTIKHSEFLSEHTIKSEISLLLSNYKHGSDIYEYRKQ